MTAVRRALLGDGNPVDPRLQVRQVHAAVDVRGEPRIAVAEDALGYHQPDAATREQRGGRTAQVVEAHRPRKSLGHSFILHFGQRRAS